VSGLSHSPRAGRARLDRSARAHISRSEPNRKEEIMRRLARLLPTSEGIARNRAKIAGFAAGIVLPLIVAGLGIVAYTGQGLSETGTRASAEIVYPNF
jgi:hypothetical protein